ncbi:MAG: dGTPase [Aquirhabdus sp.]
MEPNAAVRSRLTHSLEVAQTGRYIADLVGVGLKDREWANDDQCRALVIFVETACLMHDIGNPPFGHFGEAAVQKWFKKYGKNALEKAVDEDLKTNDMADRALADFLEFDGNPQGLRIVSRLQWNTDPFGLNLTKTTLASYLKYLRAPCATGGAETGKRFEKKAGYFLTEESVVHEVWRAFSYDRASPQRFPLAYIMEAADDIAYCISDLEDSIEKGLLNEQTAIREIAEKWRLVTKSIAATDLVWGAIEGTLSCAEKKLHANGNEFTFTDFRTSLNRILVTFAADQYINNHASILLGNFDTLIPNESAAGAILEGLKNYCKERVYCHESVQRTELAGYKAITGLLDNFLDILECNSDRFTASLDGANRDSSGEKIVTEKKLLSLFPGRYKKVYRERVEEIHQNGKNATEIAILEWNARAHLIVDFVSGMTDDYAMTTFRTLSGMPL